MTSFDLPQAGGPTPDPESERAALGRQFGDQLLAGRTERQQAIARRIYDRMKAGAEVDDVRDLIAELSRTATEDQRRRHHSPAQSPAPRPHGRAPEPDDEEQWVWSWDQGRR